jgi:hypothetical protein
MSDDFIDEISQNEISDKHKQSLNGAFYKTYTICDIHRKMYQKANKWQKSNKPITKKEIEEFNYLMERAYHFAKKMNTKLRQYKGGYDDGWYAEEAKNHKEWIKELREKE